MHYFPPLPLSLCIPALSPAVPARYLSGQSSTSPPYPRHFRTMLPIQYKSTAKWSAELRIQLLTSFRDAGFQVNQAWLFVQAHFWPEKQTHVFQALGNSAFAAGCTLTVPAAVWAKRLCNVLKSRLTPVRRRKRCTGTGRALLYCGWRLQEWNSKAKVDLQFGSKCFEPTQGQQAAPWHY